MNLDNSDEVVGIAIMREDEDEGWASNGRINGDAAGEQIVDEHVRNMDAGSVDDDDGSPPNGSDTPVPS